jgi:hemin uptake protein HemP
MNEPQDVPLRDPIHPPAPRPQQPRTWKSEDLLSGAKEILIEHHGEYYRLRETRNGKLILIK